MRQNRNRSSPRKRDNLDEYMEIRVKATEKRAFKTAADLAGVPTAVWVRERLRRAAVRELEEASVRVAFLE